MRSPQNLKFEVPALHGPQNSIGNVRKRRLLGNGLLESSTPAWSVSGAEVNWANVICRYNVLQQCPPSRTTCAAKALMEIADSTATLDVHTTRKILNVSNVFSQNPGQH